MKIEKKENYKILTFILIILSIVSFFLGFHFDENSAGAGGHNGDFVAIWRNQQIFLSYDLISAISHPDYFDSRAPTAYILHKFLNPFVVNEISYRRTVFIISLALPILFYFTLKQRFQTKDNLLLVLISSIIFLSPYYRTSSYWGLEENYGLITLLITFLLLENFKRKEKKYGHKLYINLSLIVFFSSLCLYFDQKLAIIPLICFFQIFLSEILLKYKIFLTFLYFIASLPYIYMISLWGHLVPTASAEAMGLGEDFFIEHIGYLSTIIAFYFLPLLFFKEKKFYELVKDFFKNKKNYYFILFFLIYLIYLFSFFEINNQPILGKGLIHKFVVLFFNNNFLGQIFTYFAFFVSWIIILIYVDKNIKDILILIYFFFLSIIKFPVLQEYFDPLIILMVFTFFNSKVFINYKNSLILYFYLSIFLVCCNVYYFNLLK